jgi:two-component system response regulator RegA
LLLTALVPRDTVGFLTDGGVAVVKRVSTAFVVEDDPLLAATLVDFLRVRADAVHVAATMTDAERKLGSIHVDAALLDLALPDGDGQSLLDTLWAQSSMPQVVVISGSARPDNAFRLAQAGVRAFLAKPISLESLERAWEQILPNPPDLSPLLRAAVGRVDLHTVETAVRQQMIEEALVVARGSRRKASRLLGISRQLLQHILRAEPALETSAMRAGATRMPRAE